MWTDMAVSGRPDPRSRPERLGIGGRTTLEVVVPADWSQALVREYVMDRLWRESKTKPVDLVLTECGQGTYDYQLTWLISY